jgi:UDPglucose 6-dehydrogenase
VTSALGLDHRIGRAYLTGGLGYGGPCFPRDNRALSFLARALGTTAPLAEATERANQALPRRIVARLSDVAEGGGAVAVLGLAYKPGTHVTEGSQGLLLAEALSLGGARVVAYDPLAAEQARAELPSSVAVTDTLEDAVRDAEVVLVCTPDPAFQALTPGMLHGSGQPVTVVDFWRVLEGQLGSGLAVRYLPVGRCLDDAGAARKVERMWKERLAHAGMGAVRPRGADAADALRPRVSTTIQ